MTVQHTNRRASNLKKTAGHHSLSKSDLRPSANRQISSAALVLLAKLENDDGSGMYGTIESLMHNVRATNVRRSLQALQVGTYSISILPLALPHVPAIGFRHGVSYVWEHLCNKWYIV